MLELRTQRETKQLKPNFLPLKTLEHWLCPIIFHGGSFTTSSFWDQVPKYGAINAPTELNKGHLRGLLMCPINQKRTLNFQVTFFHGG